MERYVPVCRFPSAVSSRRCLLLNWCNNCKRLCHCCRSRLYPRPSLHDAQFPITLSYSVPETHRSRIDRRRNVYTPPTTENCLKVRMKVVEDFHRSLGTMGVFLDASSQKG